MPTATPTEKRDKFKRVDTVDEAEMRTIDTKIRVLANESKNFLVSTNIIGK